MTLLDYCEFLLKFAVSSHTFQAFTSYFADTVQIWYGFCGFWGFLQILIRLAVIFLNFRTCQGLDLRQNRHGDRKRPNENQAAKLDLKNFPKLSLDRPCYKIL